jgi:membrane-bound metal-dependent hydrolase YbcI (DUF457 family)
MTKSGHLAVGGMTGLTVYSLTGSYAIAIATLVGSIAPDALEMSMFNPFTGRGVRLIPHRTITHWPILWGVALIFLFNTHFVGLALPTVLWNTLAGFCLGAITHLAMDIGTPMGIPLINPFGKRTSLNIYKTGREEWIPIGFSLALCLFGLSLTLSGSDYSELLNYFNWIKNAIWILIFQS